MIVYMAKRIGVGLAYVAVIVGFFFLRNVDYRLFGILIYAFSLIGTYEMVHAINGPHNETAEAQVTSLHMSKTQKFAVYAYALLFTPVFYIVEALADGQGYRGLLVLSFVLALALLCFLVFDHRNTTLAGTGASMLVALYPTAMLSTMLLMNELPVGSTLGLLLIHVIAPAADTFAFAVGSVFHGPKLCPSISPNKTVSGVIGGVVAGTGASVLLYWLYTLTSDYVYSGIGSAWAGAPWVVFTVIGLLTSLMTVFGDLVESVIKRRLGVKDMGKLMPTHGGILDRIDGTLFASTFVYIVFALFVVPPIA